MGKIDYEETSNSVIICKNGFNATTGNNEKFLSLTSQFNVETNIVEIDNSSFFCEIKIPRN